VVARRKLAGFLGGRALFPRAFFPRFLSEGGNMPAADRCYQKKKSPGQGMLVGLTGLCCAGKNYAAAIFERQGIPVFDVDKAGHEALEIKKWEIAERFGQEIIDSEGKVDRKKLGAAVFRDSAKLRELEAIVHPEANRITNNWIAAHADGPAIINAALLHKCDCFNRLQAVIIIRAPFPVRLWRAKKRDGLPLVQLARRLSAQKNFFSQYFSKNADNKIIVIDNCGSGLEKKLMEVRLF
jgi:dephospho-CoA kinase